MTLRFYLKYAKNFKQAGKNRLRNRKIETEITLKILFS